MPRLRFAEFALDLEAERLWRGEAAVHLTPKALQVLRALLASGGALVTRESLRASVWAGTSVTNDAIERVIGELRRALGDPAAEPRLLATVHRRGWRWLALPEPMDAHAARPFAGRTRELALLGERLAAARDGRSGFVLVSGEPGIGKSRLAEEAARAAVASGMLATLGRGGDDAAYGLWREPLLALARELGARALRSALAPDAGSLVTLLPELAGPRSGGAPAAFVGTEEARARTFDAAVRLVRRAARERPLLIVLEDLHDADSASLELFAHLAHALGDAPALVLATLRDVGRPASARLELALARVQQRPGGADALPLSGLRPSEIETLLGALTSAAIARRVSAAVHEKTSGNPLYVHEIARLVAGGGDASSASLVLEAPATVRKALAARLAALPPESRALLQLAAVAGSEFSPQLLARAAGASEPEALRALAHAERERLTLRDAAQGGARFAHGLLREILYDELRGGERARLHRRIAQAIEADPEAGGPGRDAQLAFHFGRAALGGDLDKAVHYAVLAGERAFAVQAFEVAAAQLESALDVLEARDPLDRARAVGVALAAGRAELACGRAERARACARRAVAWAREIGSAGLLAEAVTALCEFSPDHRDEADAIALVDEALARLAPSELAARARLLAERAYRSFTTGDADAQDAASAGAVDAARASRDAQALMRALRSRCHALQHPAREREWKDVYGELIALARRLGSGNDEFEALTHRLAHHFQLADAEAAQRDLRELERLAERLRTPTPRATLLRIRTGLAIARGELAEARRLAAAALAAGSRGDAELARLVSLLHFSAIATLEGRVAELVPELRRPPSGNPDLALLRAGAVFALAIAGARERARAELRALAADDFAALRRDSSYAGSLVNLTESYVLLGEPEGAQSLYELLLPYTGRVITVASWYPAGCASRYLGLLATLLGRYEQAERHFAEAVRVDRRFGAAAWEARARLDWARMLRARGARGDGGRAALLLAEAEQAAEKLGLASVAAGVAAERR